ncbi:cytoplasmic protein [Trametes meyenii]|nr:cytoplasmic protein [Trametes meyenii]
MAPTSEDLEELLLSCRYGDVEDTQQFVDKFGPEALATARDDNGNTVLHMVSANGHTGSVTISFAGSSTAVLPWGSKLTCARCVTDALDYLLPLLPPSLLAERNNAGSTPLHWAALNSHLSVAQKLVQFPGGPGVDLIDIKNSAGRSPLGEAETVGWEEGAKWFVQVMNLDDGTQEEEEVQPAEAVQDIEVEIQDAEGQVAKMTLGQKPSSSANESNEVL